MMYRCTQTVQGNVKRLNFGYRNGLRSSQVNYINALATFAGPNTLQYEENGESKKLTAKYILISVGGRPTVPSSIPGATELAITSDDVFSLKKAPGKTLVVGAAYIALESAGFLTELGFDVTVVIRSVPLRGFDRQCADKIAQLMKENGTKFINGTVNKIEKTENSKLKVTFNGDGGDGVYDTVMFAVGRTPNTTKLNLEVVGIKVNEANKIVTNEKDQTSTENVFAVGDCVAGVPELTPTAIKAAELLTRRLFNNETVMMDWAHVPSTVFTPFEYGCVGLTEEQAIATHGEDNIEVYLQEFTTLELSAVHREKVEVARSEEFDVEMSPSCLSKLITLKANSVDESDRVIGFHFIGPNAGEVTQGFALAIRLGATKKDFDSVVGIHPTDAESFTGLSVTRRSGQTFQFGGCGGGKCG
eukprot:Lankesteria_metandrocarpae@DN1414_c0_g1_i2.p1